MQITLGQTIQLSVTDAVSGTPTDPGAISLSVTDPTAATTTYTTSSSPAIVRTSVGAYSLNLTPALVGLFSYTWTTTGNAFATGSNTFTVLAATTPTIPGIQEAVRKALQTTVQAALPALNAMLTADTLWPAARPITASMVRRGDVVRMPPLSQYPLIICIEGGGRPSGQDFATVRGYISANPPGFRNTIFTNIFVYLHQDVFKEVADPEGQSELRGDLLCRLSDWLRGQVFNTTANAVVPLTSQEFTSGSNYDILDRCLAAAGYLGYFDKSFGESQTLFGVHLVHTGLVAGG
jgi:hypothetical protein